MANDITLIPKLMCNNNNFEEYIENVEFLFKTKKDTFVGSFNSWNISLNLNKNDIVIPKTLKFQLEINNKNCKLPTFILNPVSDEETTEELEIKGYDKSILFDTDFEWTQTLPCTAGELAQNVSNKVGVPLKDTNFANSDFMIYRQMADSKRTNREIIAMIAAIAGGNAFINGDDELEIRSFVDSDLVVEEYFSSDKFVKVGPITGVNLAREPIKDYKELNDAALSAKNKSCMVKITNNLIVDDNRELALQSIYNKLHGLEFYCKKIETHEAYSVKPFSFIQCAGNKVLVDTICIKYPTLIDSYISSNQLTEVESTLNIDRGIEKRIRNAEAKVDEVEGKINLLATEVSDYDNKIAELEVSVDSITQKVENVADLTREVNGATKIVLDDCMAGELIELHIYGNNTVFDSQYLSDDLYLDDDVDLFGDSLIKITGQVKDGEDIKEVSETIDLGIDTVLRQFEGVFDEYVFKDNKAQIIRRISVDDEDNKYILENEIIEDLGELTILLEKGTNYIEIPNYVANMKAKYVVINDFTSKFATTIELKSAITQLADSINLVVSQKVGKDDIISSVNIAITDGQGVIEFITNTLSIMTDTFKLYKNGYMETISAKLGNWLLTASHLYSNATSNNKTIQSGLYSKNGMSIGDIFLYAGLDISSGNTSLLKANTYITHEGLINAKWFRVNGESGYFYVDYDNGNHAMQINKEGINRYLSNGNRWTYEGIAFRNGDASSHAIFLYDAQRYEIINGAGNATIFYIERDSMTAWFTGTVYVNNGYQILTSSSDERLKKNIVDTEIEALKAIEKIHHVSFDWDTLKTTEEGHIDCGYIAQELIKINPSFVVHNEKLDTYQINTLYVLSTATKAIQELNKKVDKQQKVIDFFINKLNCKQELEEYIKEDI